ncbi:MAG: hypothetical protein HY787_20635 [Deltaproteobacteria bacterium]|nr:hypothetical protein [Deltaproteobacteria bacterium]
MSFDIRFDNEYKAWLTEIKLRIRNAQIKAALAVNTELLRFYWGLGVDIVVKQATAKWGSGLLAQLSRDLMAEFPEMKGLSERNLKYVRQWYLFYSRREPIGQQPVAQSRLAVSAKQAVSPIGQQVVAQITAIPWGHNIAIITKCKDMSRDVGDRKD